MVSSFSNINPPDPVIFTLVDAITSVPDKLVKAPEDVLFEPMGLESIVPLFIVKLFATYASDTPEPVVRTVPLSFGKLIVRSSVGSIAFKVVSKSLIEDPSKTIGALPVNVSTIVALIPVRLAPSPTNVVAVILPLVVKLSFPKLIVSDEEAMDPSLIVIFPTEEPGLIVATPVFILPVVVRFSSPNEIAPLALVKLPSAKVRFPIVDPLERLVVPALREPVVVISSSSNDIAPVELVIIPSDKTVFPTVKVPDVKISSSPNDMVPLVSLITPEDIFVEPTVIFPVVERFSSSNEIAPLKSVIEPSFKFKVPI